MKLPFGKRKTAPHHDDDAGYHNPEDRLGKPATAKGRTLLMLSMLLGLLSIACLTVGTALLQHRVNNRENNSAAYSNLLQSAHYTPYGNSDRRQWQFLWWIIAGSLFGWLLTFMLALRAVRIHQWHAALVGFHIYFLVLCTFAIDSFLWLDHSAGAKAFFGHGRLRVVVAGLIGLAVAHALAVLAFGMIPSTRHIDARHAVGVQKDRVVELPTVQPHSTTAAPPMTQTAAPTTFNSTAGSHPVRVHQGASYPHQNV